MNEKRIEDLVEALRVGPTDVIVIRARDAEYIEDFMAEQWAEQIAKLAGRPVVLLGEGHDISTISRAELRRLAER